MQSLDVPVSSILPQYFTGPSDPRNAITLRHLATMTSGLQWQEDCTENAIEKQHDWVKAILDRTFDPAALGKTGNYSTGNSHVLSAVLTKATGMSTASLAAQKLFGPLGITAEHWGSDPTGISSGGYNVYMSPREMARVGQLMLQHGQWNGTQLVPAADIADATQRVWSDPETPEFGYGQLMWLRTIDGHDMFFAWGFNGQFIYVIPSMDIVVVTTENTAGDENEINSKTFLQAVIAACKKDCNVSGADLLRNGR
ncbi:serine hydrolase domain-containing protein [Fodinicola feengrottensis]|uniref:serine hydrolase domain-containing protein n=1 Tax=Fodinicola feengrottensis TaxID=435914 RepID=UPI00244121E0|nr:serine hydrolase [Fodinicola feengrottensis]